MRRRIQFCFLLVLCAISHRAVAQTQNSADALWKAFLATPNGGNYQALSNAIQACVTAQCHEADTAGSQDDFVNLVSLLKLAEHGNRFAIDVAFEIRPLYEMAAAPSEWIENSLGLSSTLQPTFFLEEIGKYHVPDEELERLVSQTSRESVDHLSAQRQELDRRARSFSKVRQPSLKERRNRAISLIRNELENMSKLPHDDR